MKTIVTIVLLLLLSLKTAKSQANLSTADVAELNTIKNEIEGTYQIQLINTRYYPSIQLSLFKEIKEARHQNEDIYIQLSDHHRVFIPPYVEINDPSFVPLDYFGYGQTTQND